MVAPTPFGNDVVDNVDDVRAAHINNLRGWATAFMPLIANMTTIATTDASYTLSDTNTGFIVFSAVGSTDFTVYLPVESTSNHPFWICNGTTDKDQFAITIKNSSSDTLGTILNLGGQFRNWIPTGTEWLFEY
jgi:hypothetical protein